MSTNQELCQKALQEMGQNNFMKALEYFDGITPDFEYYAEIVCEKFSCMLNAGEPQMVLDRFHEMPEDSQSYSSVVVNKIIALKNVERYKEAFDEYQKLNLQPDHDAYIIATWHASMAAIKTKEYESTDKMLNSLLEMPDVKMNANSDLEQIYDMLIEAANEMQNADKAAYYGVEKTGWVNAMKGFKALNREKYDEAIAFYDKVPQESSMYQNTLIDRMKLLVDCDKHEEALALFEDISKDDDFYTAALINKQAALNNLVRYSESLKTFEQILEDDPHYAMALGNAILSARLAKQYDIFLDLAEKSIDLAQDEEEEEKAIYNKALACYFLGRYEDVIELLEEIDEESTDDEGHCPMCCDNQTELDAVYLLGCTYRKLGDTTKSNKYFEEAEGLSSSGVSATIIGQNGERQTMSQGYNRPFDPDKES